MKKIVSLLLVAAMALSLVACGGNSSSAAGDSSTAGNSTASGDVVAGFDKPASEMGVTLVLNTNLGDHAICDLSNEGLQEAAEKYGFKANVVELGGCPAGRTGVPRSEVYPV